MAYVGRAVDVQLSDLENLSLRVRDLALDIAGVVVLDGSELDLEDLVALLTPAQPRVERVRDGSAVADDTPRRTAALAYTPQDGRLDLLQRVDVLQVASDFDGLAGPRLFRVELDFLDLRRALLG